MDFSNVNLIPFRFKKYPKTKRGVLMRILKRKEMIFMD